MDIESQNKRSKLNNGGMFGLFMKILGSLFVLTVLFEAFTNLSTEHFELLAAAVESDFDWRQFYGVENGNILVTGAAGFVGSHLSMKLKSLGHTVVGVDNFNDYYDVRLKFYRSQKVEAAGIDVVNADLCDDPAMRDLFKTRGPFTHVVHLAAQAGVRYSLKDPLAYGTANVMCTITLMEIIKDQPKIPVYLYASSSSVYGNSKTVPFRETQSIETPTNLYAASKHFCENVAYAYNHLYKIRSTGLRFFTVYGPMGRPDMAAWMWTKSGSEGGKINLYVSDDGPVQRDFTFIDDIVDGIVKCVEHSANLEVFNLGRGEPQVITELLSAIQAHPSLQKATVSMHPLPPSDMRVTYADTSHSKRVLGYQPSVSIEEGATRFAAWYLNYTAPALPEGFKYAQINIDNRAVANREVGVKHDL